MDNFIIVIIATIGFLTGIMFTIVYHSAPETPKFYEFVNTGGLVRVIEDSAGNQFYLFYVDDKVVKLEKKTK